MKQGSRSIRYINSIFGIVFGWLIFRLILGPYYEYPALYTHLVWIFLYPVHLLRQQSDLTIYILFYTLFWLYIFIVKVVVLNAPLLKTLFTLIIWMPVVALPFLPFGVEYFSLALYVTSISNYLMRLLPFIGLLICLFLVNHFFFNQRYLFAGTWALVNFLLIIVVVTLSNLLPALKSQIFFHALGYRLSLANDLISVFPLLTLLMIMCLSVFYVFIFESQFFSMPYKRTTLISIATPIGLLVALSLVLMIMRDDFRRYRYFDYQEGIATVYFARYDDRQIVSFEDARFTLSGSRYSVFYPFGKFNIVDTLHRHAEEILRMKMIEGLDYYRLERIAKILAYGPRDEDTYDKLRHVVLGNRYLLPEGLRSWARYLEHRYTAPLNDIEVTGTLMLNGRPLGNAEFYVNLVSMHNRRTVEPIWQGVTEPSGRFGFTCYRDVDSDDAYFSMTLLVSDGQIRNNIGFLKLTNLVPVFREPATYALDTTRIETGLYDEENRVNYLNVKTSSHIDSFSLALPRVYAGGAVMITGSVSPSGTLENILIDHQPLLNDSLLVEEMIERVRLSRFYLEDSTGTLDIQMY